MAVSKKWNGLLSFAAVAALVLHFWPMAYWSGTTLLLLRLTAAFCAQLFFCRAVHRPGWKTLPLLLTELWALWGGWLAFLTRTPGYETYALPLLACLAGWLVWALCEKQPKSQWLSPVGKALGLSFILSITLIPALLFLVLYLGWPPVLGNLTAARAMNQYAAQVYPEWKADDIWAGYNLVDDGYYQEFYHGETRYSLSSNRSGSMVSDDEREAAYRRDRGINKALDRLNAGYGYAMFWVNWSAGAPDFPYVTLRVDLSDGADTPVPDETAMRKKMADRALEVYGAIAPLAPVHKFAVLYHHPALDEEDVLGSQWHHIEVDLADGRPLTQDDILFGKLTKR